MRKYSVYNLKVVKVETSTNTKYLICRYNNLTKEYIEVLTGEKIEVKNSENVEPLLNYYSVLGLHCYGVPGSELELTKRDILSKYLEINSEEIERQKNDNENTSNERLNPFSLHKQELLEIALLGDPGDDEFKVNYFPTNVITKSLILDSCKKEDDKSHINNKELTELTEGLKRTREELVTLCETNPEQAKKLAIEALIRTGVIESSDEIEKSKPSVDIDLTKNQVKQIPVKLNDEKSLLPLSNNRVFDEYQSPTLSIPMFANREFEELHQRSFPVDETPVLSDYINTNDADTFTGIDMVKLADTNGDEISVSKLYDAISCESNDNVEKGKAYIKERKDK